jgi:hypothetical protein
MVFTYKDHVRSVQLTFRPSSFPIVKELLRRRYGRPTRRTERILESGSGIRVRSEVLGWTGKDVTLIALEHSGRIIEGTADFSHNDTSARAQQELQGGQAR